jgi:two-component system response regulator HydG
VIGVKPLGTLGKENVVESKASILIVDDEPAVRDSLGKWFEEEGYSVTAAASAQDALRKLTSERWDLALVDVEMPGMDGLELQRKLCEVDPEITVIIMTGHASVETAVQALKDGAYDYLTKPFDPDDLAHLVRKALDCRGVRRESVRLWESLAEARAVELVGQSSGMRKVLELVRTVAPTDTTVLIRGESGTGKEQVARAIHHLSPRRFMPIVTLHCGALTETLLESELFGHEKGALPGAQYRKKGKFEVAEGGTVFLDEISDVSPKTQADLLRALQEKEIQRLGGTQTIKVDFRAVAAASKDLEALVKQGTFRPDLFYRLNVFAMKIPPLRERKEDIPVLVNHFIHKHARGMNKGISSVSRTAMDLLMNYSWPGNVRELENVLEHAMVLGREPEIQASDLPLHIAAPGLAEAAASLEDVERAHILHVLEACDWNQTRAAKVLRIDRVTLYNKIKKYGFRKGSAATS